MIIANPARRCSKTAIAECPEADSSLWFVVGYFESFGVPACDGFEGGVSTGMLGCAAEKPSSRFVTASPALGFWLVPVATMPLTLTLLIVALCRLAGAGD